MKAYVDNKVVEIEIKNSNYNDHAVEAIIKSGMWAGTWVIINKKDLIEEPKKIVKETKPRFKDVKFIKCDDYDSFGERKHFWRADLGYETIVTLCRTKKECIEEVRSYLKTL